MLEQPPTCDPETDQGQATPVDLGQVQAERDECGCPFCGICEINQEVR